MNTIKLNSLTKATTVSFVVFAYLLIITALSLYVLNTTTTHADTTSATASVTVPSACTLTSTITSGNAHNTTMVAGTFEEDIGTTNLKAICNDPDGLDIYAVGYSSNTLGNTNLVGDNGLNITTGLNTSSSTGDGHSNWAMKLFFPASTDANANTVYQPNILSDTNGSYAEYHVIPATSTKVASFNAVTDTVVGSNLNTTYRIYLEPNQPAGTYIGQVKYTITHPNTSFSLYMQDFTPEMCNTLGTAVTKTVTLYDKRDDNSYTVTYINGQCWMTQNLRITGTIPANGSNFTGADIDVSTSLTTGLSYDVPKTYTGVDSNGDPTVWYNFAAATAGTIVGNSNTNDAVQDICPSGWRLPTGPNSVTGTDFNRLIGTTEDYWQDLTEGFVQFNPVGGGNYWAGFENPESGFWWSATADADTERDGYYGRRYAIWYNGNTEQVFGSNYPLRAHGQFIRCVLETRDITSAVYMQDVNKGMVKNTQVGTMVSLKDRRDNVFYKVSKLADENLWMLENLALDIADSTVQANMTRVSTNATDAVLGYLKNGGGTSPYAANAVSKSSWYNSVATPYINITSKDVEVTGYGLASSNNKAKVGIYYNYCAASAGSYCYSSNDASGDAIYDICPASWRMPTGGSGGEFENLCSAIRGVACSGSVTMEAVNSNSLQYALSTPLSGYYSNGQALEQNVIGDYWSSSRYGVSTMSGLYVDSSAVSLGDYTDRVFGRAIRCIVSAE